MSACFLLLLLFNSPSLSSHRDCVHSCQEGRRCLWSRLDKDQASPSCCPHPLPGKMVAPSLAGHQLLFECAASRGSGDLTWFVSLLLRVCPQPLTATKGLVSWYKSGAWGRWGGVRRWGRWDEDGGMFRDREMSQGLNVKRFLSSSHHKKETIHIKVINYIFSDDCNLNKCCAFSKCYCIYNMVIFYNWWFKYSLLFVIII